MKDDQSRGIPRSMDDPPTDSTKPNSTTGFDGESFNTTEIEAERVRCKLAGVCALGKTVYHVWHARVNEEMGFFLEYGCSPSSLDHRKMIMRAIADCRARFPMLSDEYVHMVMDTREDQIDELLSRRQYPDFTW
jgi:hypothetical protein